MAIILEAMDYSYRLKIDFKNHNSAHYGSILTHVLLKSLNIK